MGIQVISGSGSALANVGEVASAAQHVALHPRAGNWYRYSGYTGIIAAAVAANSEVLQFRFVTGAGKTLALVTRVELEGLAVIAAATAAGPLGFELVPARSWTAAGSGGTRIATTGDNLQMRTSEPVSQVSDLGIATTGALTAGTKTLDANAIGGVMAGIGTAAITSFGLGGLSGHLMSQEAAELPLVLANQEGFVVRTSHVGPATLTYVARFGIEWCEVTDF